MVSKKLTIGKIMIVKKDIQTADGMIYSGSRVEIESAESEKKIRVKDGMGRIFYLRYEDLESMRKFEI